MFTFRDLVLLSVAIGITIYAWVFTRWNREDTDKIPILQYASDPHLTQGHVPKPCFGYDKERDQVLGRYGGFCPPHHAFLLNLDERIRFKHLSEGRVVQLLGTCCPLPADDILTDEHVYNAVESCPYNFVATGGTGPRGGCGKSCTMRCTKINTERYKLGDEYPAMYWKMNLTKTSSGRGAAHQIKWHQIPLALRYAAGREQRDDWFEDSGWAKDGCVGVPFGSLLVKKKRYTCDGFYYRPLLFKDGSAVRILPECRKIENLISQSKPALCVQ